MNHSGGANGGHYYVFIESFENQKWYNFDDSIVSELDIESIPSRCFGGGKYSNAYMLIYERPTRPEDAAAAAAAAAACIAAATATAASASGESAVAPVEALLLP